MNYDYNDSYYYSDLDDHGWFIFIFILAALAIGLIAYIISALIYFMTSKTNGFGDVAYIAWIPIINVYSLFLLTAGGDTRENNTCNSFKKYAYLCRLDHCFVYSIYRYSGFFRSGRLYTVFHVSPILPPVWRNR